MASTLSIPERDTNRALIFRAGGSVYGCPVESVLEILPARPATRLPGAPPCVLGLINVRGTIVTVIDLARRLDPTGEAGASLRRRGSILLFDRAGRPVGIAVDSVVDVRAVEEDLIPGGSMEGGAVRAVARVGNMDVVMIDLGILVTQIFTS